jgi:hypothetical protein
MGFALICFVATTGVMVRAPRRFCPERNAPCRGQRGWRTRPQLTDRAAQLHWLRKEDVDVDKLRTVANFQCVALIFLVSGARGDQAPVHRRAHGEPAQGCCTLLLVYNPVTTSTPSWADNWCGQRRVPGSLRRAHSVAGGQIATMAPNMAAPYTQPCFPVPCGTWQPGLCMAWPADSTGGFVTCGVWNATSFTCGPPPS